ncbi:hypothetical protein JM707_002193 [Shigella sonnei]|nr:hypothetical protein [Shigella sonnei]
MKTVHGKITVFSDDIYLTQGLIKFFENNHPFSLTKTVTFIDVERLKTIPSILQILQSLDRHTVVAGIGRGGVISKYFSPVVFSSIDEPLPTLAGRIRSLHHTSCTAECWINRCHVALKPPFLTQTQMRIFSGLKKGLSIHQLSRIHVIDLKTCYCHSGAIVRKLRLKNITELRLLLTAI